MYPDDVEKVIGLLEAIVGIGCTSGPVFGSLVYEFLGFKWTFLAFGMLQAPTAVLACFLRKNTQVKSKQANEEGEDRNDSVTKQNIEEIFLNIDELDLKDEEES